MVQFLNALFGFLRLLLEHFKTRQKKQEAKERSLTKSKAEAYENLQKALAARRAISRNIVRNKRMSDDRYKRKE